MEKEFYAHFRPQDESYQLNKDHAGQVARLSEAYCRVGLLKKAAWLIGLHHDDGKNEDAWQEYFQEAIENNGKQGGGKEDHSTMGGLVLNSYAPGTRFAEMAQVAVYMHHGLADCISLTDGSALIQKRRQKYRQEEIEHAAQLVQEQFLEADMEQLCRAARADINALSKRICEIYEEGKGKYGHPDFYVGMCERLLFSCLMDADWRDTADFAANAVTKSGMQDSDIWHVWEQGICNLEKKLSAFGGKEQINLQRKKISDQCRNAAFTGHSLYRLAVPTGAGKTLGSLRFALYCAREYRKRHIFYISPFCSVTEQNAEEIRDALGMPEMVLEHHGNVVREEGEQQERYERLIENWDGIPVIATTAVQFLNTLFREKKRNIRRFHSLCDSVIIVDEVQAMPVKVLALLNLAVNFLTALCGTTVVLCTATQPLLSEIRENRMMPPANMTDALSAFGKAFLRVEYHDCVEECSGGMSVEEAAAFALEKERAFGQVLFIFNTRAAARKVYELLKGKTQGRLFHLSTWMCAENRSDRLKEIRQALAGREKVICISTQLVEAGVDVSFRCVVRSLAGLDNLVQAAGRCNRNGEATPGHVFLVRMAETAESLSSLPDIRKAQEAMQNFLCSFRKNPEEYGGRMDSENAIRDYYRFYFHDRQEEMKYPVKMEGVNTDLVNLLSCSYKFRGEQEAVKLRQAFRSAGEAFSVIEEKGGTDVVVIYKDSAGLLSKLAQEGEPEQKRRIIRQLQRYVVNLPDGLLRRMGGTAVYEAEDGSVLVLEGRFYDENVGVTEEPGQMPFLIS